MRLLVVGATGSRGRLAVAEAADHASTMNHPMFAAKLIAHLTAHRA